MKVVTSSENSLTHDVMAMLCSHLLLLHIVTVCERSSLSYSPPLLLHNQTAERSMIMPTSSDLPLIVVVLWESSKFEIINCHFQRRKEHRHLPPSAATHAFFAQRHAVSASCRISNLHEGTRLRALSTILPCGDPWLASHANSRQKISEDER